MNGTAIAENVVGLTPAAAAEMQSLQAKPENTGKHMRFYVEQGGCSGMQYGMVFDEQRAGDLVSEQHGVQVLVDAISADFLRTCPDLVVVDRRSPRDYVAIIGNADPGFLEVWRRYERIAAFDGLVVFRRIHTKRDAATNNNGCHTPKPLRG